MPSSKRRDDALIEVLDAKLRRRQQADRHRYTPIDPYEPVSQLIRAKYNGELQQRLWRHYGWAPVEVRQ